MLSSRADGDTDICLRLDATCALPNDQGGWLLEDAAGTELRLTGGQLSAQLGQRLRQVSGRVSRQEERSYVAKWIQGGGNTAPPII